MNTNPKTRMYTVRVPSEHGGFATSPWARIWITEDGCFTSISDHGNYSYWWPHPGCEFREFLIGCDDDYLIGKFSDGQRVFDPEDTVENIKRIIHELSVEGELGITDIERELELIESITNEFDFGMWFTKSEVPKLIDIYSRSLDVYCRPVQVEMFVKKIWPEFVKMLRAELDSERAQRIRAEDAAGV